MRDCGLVGIALLCALNSFALETARTEPTLGQAPSARDLIAGLPGGEPRPLGVTSGFSVNTFSREQARDFYNSIFTASENIPMATTANTVDCEAGTNSTAFQNAVLWRVNWYRAMAGVPAAVAFSAAECAEDQEAALMMSANGQALHTEIPTNWSCFTTDGTNAAANSNLALGSDGPDAITGYMWDYGAANWAVGHRRWILYPQAQVMATGDVPAEGTNLAANGTWIKDANYGGPRPPTTAPYVSWPPPGYVPCQVVYPQWSFALSNADLSIATVTMQSNGVPLSVTVQPYTANYGEDSLVWYPSNLDPTSQGTLFPFGGIDTVYSVTVSNVRTDAGMVSFSYNTTLFDPAVAGADFVATAISGPTQPSTNENNLYGCGSLTNLGLTGYQWLVSQSTNGNLTDNAKNGLVNFTVTPAPIYSIITNPPVGTGNCFHLTHTNPVPQLMQLNQVLFPATNTTLSFKSLLGYATADEIARVQISTNGGTVWFNIFSQAGSGGTGQTNFTANVFSLSNYAGCFTLLRFNYDYNSAGGSYYPKSFPDVGWCIENVVVTNTSQLVNIQTNATSMANFNFSPVKVGGYELNARGVLYGQFTLDLGPVKMVTAITNAAPTTITLSTPQLSGSLLAIAFAESQGTAMTFQLLQAGQLTGPWTTNASAVLTTNLAGSWYQFTTTVSGGSSFYRVHAP